MKRALFICLISLCLMSSSRAGHYYYSYSEWERLPLPSRASYLAGIYDVLVTLDRGDGWANRISDCIALEARMDQIQMANNLVAFARNHPEFQTDAASLVFWQYLTKICQPH